jgi:hypothetical protein
MEFELARLTAAFSAIVSSLVVGRWSLVVGRWSLVVGRWLLVVGHWLTIITKHAID